METYGWIYNAKRVSLFEGIPFEQSLDIPLIQFFNDLSYIKAKEEYDKKLIKDARNTEQ